MQGSRLPSLLQSRLNAPRILKVTKVASYVIGKLQEEGLIFQPRRAFYEPAWQAQLEVGSRQCSSTPAAPDAANHQLVYF